MNDLTTPKPFACKADGCGLSFTNEDHLTVHEKKHEMSLSLSFEQKSANIFVADQTPTPTRLIKNCEEVGLFEDLRHVNPFDETFRRAVEQKTQSNLATDLPVDINSNSHDSLHTPQVFPNIENPEQNITCQQSVVTPLPKPSPSPVLEPVRNAPTKSHKVLPTILPKQPTKLQQGSTIHLIQPQVIALSFPTPSVNSIPIQTVKPFVLPKNDAATTNPPPSTLPIKERLKAILNSNSKGKQFTSGKLSISQESKNSKNEQAKHSFDDDCLERKRAASLRYRNKIKTEHLDLKRKNTELLSENIRLKEEIKKLHSELDNLRNSFADTSNQNQIVVGRAPEIQIPPSTVRLIMNIPQVVIRPTGQAVMKSPVTVSIKKD